MPIQTENHGIIHVHSIPIKRAIFEQFYLELGKVYSQCFDNKNPEHFILSAPQLAYPALKSIATKSGAWDEVKAGLVNEIIRLTSVMICGDKGWETLPLDIAMKRELLDEDEEAEVLSSLVFFTVICKVAPKELRTSFMEMSASMRNWVLTSLDSMAYKNSLQTSTKEGVSGSPIASLAIS